MVSAAVVPAVAVSLGRSPRDVADVCALAPFRSIRGATPGRVVPEEGDLRGRLRQSQVRAHVAASGFGRVWGISGRAGALTGRPAGWGDGDALTAN